MKKPLKQSKQACNTHSVTTKREVKSSFLKPTSLMMALEPRVMFDGAAVATSELTHSKTIDFTLSQGLEGGVHPALMAQRDAMTVEKTVDTKTVPLLNSTEKTIPPQTINATSKDILFIDSYIANYQLLVEAAEPGIEVIVLDAQGDGLQQIAAVLSDRRELNSISIVSHGNEGEVFLGKTVLNHSSLTSYQAELATIGQALSTTGDIQLYGCDVGHGIVGQQFIQDLAEITGADVAASTNLTGAKALGGDWVLEVSHGEVATTPIFRVAGLDAYAGLLTPDPQIAHLDADTVAWAGSGNAVILDSGGDLTVSDSTNDVSGWGGSSLTVQRVTASVVDASSHDVLNFNTAGASFTVSGADLKSGGQTFATFTSANGVMSISFTSSETTATTALVQDVMRHINYRNDTPYGNTTIRFALNNGTNTTNADVAVTSSTIYADRAGDSDVEGDAADGFSLREALARGNAQGGADTIKVVLALHSTINLGSTVMLGSGDTLDLDLADGVTLSGASISLGGDVTVSNGSPHEATISAAMTGAHSLTKTGSGTLILSGINTYSGSTTISAGTLRVANHTHVGSGALILDGGTFYTTGQGTSDFNGGMSNTDYDLFSNAITLGANGGTFNASGDAKTMITGALTGSTALTKMGSGFLYFTNATSYTGDITVILGGIGVYGSSTLGTGQIRFAEGCALMVGGVTKTLTNHMVLDGDSIEFRADDSSLWSEGASITFSGVISEMGGSRALTLVGSDASNSFIFSGTNTYTGTTTLNSNATLSVGSGASLGAGDIVLSTGATLAVTASNTITNAINLYDDANINVSDAVTATLSGLISGSTALTKTGAGTLVLSNTGNQGADSGTVIVSAGTLSIIADANLSSGALTLNGGTLHTGGGDWTLNNAIVLGSEGGTLDVENSYDLTLTGGMSGSGNFTKTGVGNLDIQNNTATYTGTTTLSGGSMTILSDSNIGTGNWIMSGGYAYMYVDGTIDNNIVLNNVDSRFYVVSNNTNLTFSGVISGSGTLWFSQASTTQVTLTGTNTYTGRTELAAVGGAGVSIAGDANLGSGGLQLYDAVLTVTGDTTIDNTIELYGSDGGTIHANSAVTLSGVVSEASNFIKTGSGTLTLTGTQTHTGNTTVLGGALSIASDANLGSGSLTLDSGGLLLSAAGTVDNAIVIGSNGATITNANSNTLSGVMSGSGTLSKNGVGTLTLNATQTRTGTTAINAGTISVASESNIGAGAITLSGGSTLQLSTAGAFDNAISLGSGGGVISNANSNTLSGVLSGANGLSKIGAGALTLTGTQTYTGTTTVSAGTLSIASDTNVGSGVITLNSGTLQITSAGTIDNAMVLGSDGGTITNANNNTLSGIVSGSGTLSKNGGGALTLTATQTRTGATAINAGIVIVASESNIGVGAIALSGGSILQLSTAGSFDNAISLGSGGGVISNMNSNTLSGVLSGTNGLSKVGVGILTLTGTQTHTGTTTVSAGTLRIASDANLGSGVLTLNSGTLQINFAGTIDNAIALGSNGGVISNAATNTLSGVVSGVGSLAKEGDGLLTLAATQTYTGGTAIREGTLSVAGDANLGSGALSLNGGTLALSASGTIDNTIALGSHGGVISNISSNTLSGVISGIGSLTKEGDGTLTLAATQTHTGETTIEGGNLSVAADANLGSGTLTLNGGSLTLSTAGTVDNAVVIEDGGINVGESANATLSGVISGNAGLYVEGAENSTLTLTGNNTYTGITTVNSATLAIASAANISSSDIHLLGATLSISGAATFSGNINLVTGYSTIRNDASVTLSGVLSGVGSLTKSGSGVLTLSGIQTQTGNTTIADGAISIASDANLGAGSIGLEGGSLYVTAEAVIDNAIHINSAANLNTDSNLTLSGVLSGSGELTKTGTGTLSLTGTQTHTGAMTIFDSELKIASSANVGSGVITLNGGSLHLIGNTSLNNELVLDGVSDVIAVDTGINAALLGTLSGSATLQKELTGTLTLAGTNTNTGSTSVEAGALFVTGRAGGNGAGTVTVLNGGTLGGTGTVNGALTVNSGATLSPGVSGAGVLTLNNDLTLASGSILAIEINGNTAGTGYDQVVVMGGVTINNAMLSSTLGYTPVSADRFTLIANDGVDPIVGAFQDVAEDASLTLNGLDFNASYEGVTGNDMRLTLPPTATLVMANTVLKVGETSLLTITFSEPITSLTNSHITVPHGTLSTLASSDGGMTWTATFTPDSDVSDTTNVLTFDMSSVHDADQVQGSGSVNSNNVAIDTVRPSATIIINDTSLKLGETAEVTITFSEAVTDFSNADLAVAHGTLSTVSSNDGGVTWRATFTPTVEVSTTSNVITLTKSGVNDLAGNAGSGSKDSNVYAVDTIRPNATIVIDDTALKLGETAGVTITFTEVVTDFSNADLTVANGTLSAVSSNDGGVTWRATFTPNAEVSTTTNVITLTKSGVNDLAGNAGSGSIDSNVYFIDTVRPGATIVIDDTALKLGETATVTITFNEAVTDFTNADLTVTNGTLSTVSSSNGGLTWTATFTPEGGIQANVNVIRLDQSSVNDLAGNSGNGMVDSNTYAVTTLIPIISSATYDAATGLLVVSGSGFLGRTGVNNDIDVSKLSLMGESGSPYILTTENVDIDSNTTFTIHLNAQDKTVIDQRLNKEGTLSASGSAYNLVAAEEWETAIAVELVTADLTGNAITVSHVAPIIPPDTGDTADLDGLTAETENGGGGDFNHDGLNDALQTDVATTPLVKASDFTQASMGNVSGVSYGSIIAGDSQSTGMPDHPGDIKLRHVAVNAAVGSSGGLVLDNISNQGLGAATDIISFSAVADSNHDQSPDTNGFSDADTSREGTQVRFTLELGGHGVLATHVMKVRSDGSSFDYTATSSDIDGGQLIDTNHDGRIDRIILTITDNGIGDANTTIGVIDDPIFLAVENQAPHIVSNGGQSSASIEVSELTQSVTTVRATDSDSDTLTYMLSGGADREKFTLNAQTGELRFLSNQRTETPTDSDKNNRYTVEVTVSDGKGGIETQSLAVIVMPATNPSVYSAHGTLDSIEDAFQSIAMTHAEWREISASQNNASVAIIASVIADSRDVQREAHAALTGESHAGEIRSQTLREHESTTPNQFVRSVICEMHQLQEEYAQQASEDRYHQNMFSDTLFSMAKEENNSDDPTKPSDLDVSILTVANQYLEKDRVQEPSNPHGMPDDSSDKDENYSEATPASDGGIHPDTPFSIALRAAQESENVYESLAFPAHRASPNAFSASPKGAPSFHEQLEQRRKERCLLPTA